MALAKVAEGKKRSLQRDRLCKIRDERDDSVERQADYRDAS